MKRILALIGSMMILGTLWTSVLAQTLSTSTLEDFFPSGTELPPEILQKVLEERARIDKEIREQREAFEKERTEAIEKNLESIKAVNGQEIVKLGLRLNRKDLKPGTQIRISVDTYSLNLGESAIVWYHNNKRVSSGSGNVSYGFTLGDLGTAESIRVVITTSTGKIYEISKTIRPARIYITWGADTHTPAWYRGKTLPPPGTPIKVFAIPDFRIGTTVLSSQDIIYEWLINDAPRSSSSGVNGKGKNTFSYTTGSSANIEYKITVRGKDARERIVHEESFTMRAYRPELIFYERDPLLGLKYWQALKNIKTPSGKDIVLQFEPFNLHSQDLDRLFYSWRVNSQKLANQNPQSRVFRLSSEEGSTGTQSVNVSYENPKNVFMRGSAQVIIQVGN
ncbi:MAG: hypothetical protein AAB417_01860 [Patescibacteria group bacterium]